MKKISIVLPAYNEAKAIPIFHQDLRGVLNGLSERYEFEIIYVLDPSSDGSIGVLRHLAATEADVSVLHLSRRFGHQLSLIAGIDHSQGEAVIMMDCDLQHPPALIPALLDYYEQGYDIVQSIRQYDRRIGFLKRRLSDLFYRIQNLLSPIEIEAGAADFRLISSRVAGLFKTRMREQSPFLRGLFRWVGYRTVTLRFQSPPRIAGETKYRLKQLLAFSIMGITSFSKVPLRIGSFLGIAISLLSVIYGIFIVAAYFISGSFPAGYASIVLSVLFIGGLQLMVLGFIGEYLGSIFDEVKRRPLYIVDEIIQGSRQ
jgi:polyisoprenyl-phosphate glycosyltransferase